MVAKRSIVSVLEAQTASRRLLQNRSWVAQRALRDRSDIHAHTQPASKLASFAQRAFQDRSDIAAHTQTSQGR